MWPGTIIHADYRLLVPSTGFDIALDVKALFTYLLTLPLDHHNLFLSGFSGGGYPLRLAVVEATKEAQTPTPRYTVQGWFSCFGMGGDLLLDYWLTPRDPTSRQLLSLSPDDLAQRQDEAQRKVDRYYAEKVEYSDTPYTPGLSGHTPERNHIWEAFHVCASINDVITGRPGFSEQLAKVPYGERRALIQEEDLVEVYPQIYLAEHASKVPPVLLIHGDADESVPYDESRRTLRDIVDGGGRAELITVPGGDHNLSIDGVQTREGHEGLEYAAQWMLKLAKRHS